MITAALFACTVAVVVDGDGVRCRERDLSGREIRVRLSGINARELTGDPCPAPRPCVEASGIAARAALQRIAPAGTRLQCRAMGRSWRRVSAFCRREGGVDLSCAMLRTGTVAYWVEYDRDGRLRRCGM